MTSITKRFEQELGGDVNGASSIDEVAQTLSSEIVGEVAFKRDFNEFKDGWGNAFFFTKMDGKAAIGSPGEDSFEGTDDDIVISFAGEVIQGEEWISGESSNFVPIIQWVLVAWVVGYFLMRIVNKKREAK